MNNNKIGIGMVGYGWMARVHTFGLKSIPINILPNKDLELVAVCGRTKSKLKDMAAQFGYKKTYTDWEDLVKDPDVELVDNVTPPNVHADPAILAAEEGKPQICEKPLAATVEDGKKMVQAVENSGTPNMVMFNYRFLPAIQTAKKWIEAGNLGKIYQTRFLYTKQSHLDSTRPFSWKDNPDISGGGPFIDLGVHVADLSRFLVGDVKKLVSENERWIDYRPKTRGGSDMKEVKTEDAGISILRYENGAMGILEASKTSTGYPNTVRVEINGSEGSLVWNSERTRELHIHRQENGKNTWTTQLLSSPYDDSYGRIGIGHVEGLKTFIDQYNTDKQDYPNFKDGLEALKIIKASYTSAKEQRWIRIE